MVVAKQSRLWWRFLTVERLVGRTIDEVNVEPAIVVVVQQRYTRSFGFEDEAFLRSSCCVMPTGKASLLGGIHENDGPCLDHTACGNGPMGRVVDSLIDSPS